MCRRIARVISGRGPDNCLNLAVIQPDELYVKNRSITTEAASGDKHIVSPTRQPSQRFFLPGSVTFVNLKSTEGRQVCLAPFAHTWFRALAVLGNVVNEDDIFFSGFKGGISVSTMTGRGERTCEYLLLINCELINKFIASVSGAISAGTSAPRGVVPVSPRRMGSGSAAQTNSQQSTHPIFLDVLRASEDGEYFITTIFLFIRLTSITQSKSMMPQEVWRMVL